MCYSISASKVIFNIRLAPAQTGLSGDNVIITLLVSILASDVIGLDMFCDWLTYKIY